MKTKTHDRMEFLTVEKLGPKQSVTPEGFLLCEAVPIARVGVQMYSTDEIPLDGDSDGLIKIERSQDEVFKDETLASFEGKPVTIDHPDTFVNPENWKELAKGVTQNVRRGTGIEDDLLLADLLITDQEAIEAVRKDGLREVSCGYEADYEQTGPGAGRQLNIIGNHVALVERGRAGPRCSIQDKDLNMKTKSKDKKLGFIDKLRRFLDSEAQAEQGEEMKDEDLDLNQQQQQEPPPEDQTDDEDNGIEARLARIEEVLAKLIPAEEEEHGQNFDAEGDEPGRDDEDVETGDDVLEAEKAETNGEAVGKVLSGDTLKAVIARAEILAPGVQVQTGDAAKTPGAIASLKRKALTTAYATADGKKAIDVFLAGRSIKLLTGDALNSVFAGAAELMRNTNNTRGVRQSAAKTTDFGKPTNPADINARNKAFWAK